MLVTCVSCKGWFRTKSNMLFSVSNVDGLTADCCKTGECGKTAVHDTNGACGESSVCRKSVNFGELSVW